ANCPVFHPAAAAGGCYGRVVVRGTGGEPPVKRLRLFFLVASSAALAACLIFLFVTRARAPQGSRVEVVFFLPDSQAEEAMAETLTFSEDQLATASQSWDDGRWTWTGCDPFTAQYLGAALRQIGLAEEQFLILDYSWADEAVRHSAQLWQITGAFCLLYLLGALIIRRSEEHTSELQSRFDLVCRLLLEKKKKKTQKEQIET